MMREIHKDDITLEPDSSEDDRFFSDEWLSNNGALIDVIIDTACWHTLLIEDLKARGPMMLDCIAARLSLNPQKVSLFLCNDRDMRAMNHKHRGVDKVTNVLSFPDVDRLQWADNMLANEATIGDIAVAGETVECEAREAGIAASDHLLHLFTHGILHLLGYDHDEDSAATEMEELEIEFLAKMQIANPYYCDDPIFGTRENG